MRGRFTRRRWLAAGAALVILGGVGIALVFALNGHFTIEGSVRPVLTLQTLSGQSFHLISPYGRRHLLIFFLVSCPHCHEALEHLRRLRPWSRGCDLFAVSLSERTPTTSFVAGQSFGFPVLTMSPRLALSQLGVRRVPTMLLVSESDRVDWMHVGGRTFVEDSVMIVRYCNGDSWEFSAVDSLGRMGRREISPESPSERTSGDLE